MTLKISYQYGKIIKRFKKGKTMEKLFLEAIKQVNLIQILLIFMFSCTLCFVFEKK